VGDVKHFVAYLTDFGAVKEFWKSVKVWWNYRHKRVAFLRHGVVCYCHCYCYGNEKKSDRSGSHFRTDAMNRNGHVSRDDWYVNKAGRQFIQSVCVSHTLLLRVISLRNRHRDSTRHQIWTIRDRKSFTQGQTDSETDDSVCLLVHDSRARQTSMSRD